MTILETGTSIAVGKDTITIQGKSLSGSFGVWVLKRGQRIFAMEPVIRMQKFSNEKIMSTARSL